MARLPLLAGGFEQLNLSHREYWLCEGALGAAGRPGSGGLQCRRADYGAGAGRLALPSPRAEYCLAVAAKLYSLSLSHPGHAARR